MVHLFQATNTHAGRMKMREMKRFKKKYEKEKKGKTERLLPMWTPEQRSGVLSNDQVWSDE